MAVMILLPSTVYILMPLAVMGKDVTNMTIPITAEKRRGQNFSRNT